MVLALYATSSAFSYAMGWIMSGVSADVAFRLRRDISSKVHKIPFAFFDGTTRGETLSRVTNDVDTVNQTLSQGLAQVISSGASVVGVLIMMASIDWRMTLLSIGMVPLSLFIVGFIVRKSQGHFKKQQEYLGHVNGHVEEMFGGHAVVKAFNGEARSVERFEGYNSGLYDAAWKSQFLSGLMMPLMNFVGNVGYVGVCILGGWLAAMKAITVGDIQAFIQYVRNFTQPITQLANVGNVLQQTAAAAERVFAFLDEKEEAPDPAAHTPRRPIRGSVEFKGVRFGYDSAQPVIKGFSALAHPGQKIAIVGKTGAGKTTMVKLLMRFYDVDSGSITLDGVDVRDYPRAELRKSFAMVLQDAWLYHDTVMENIRYGRPDATDGEVIEAAKAAYVDHFAHTLPDGYGMVVNEETSNLSQGQKQLLTIARAILADPSVLILDEATSSVDTRTELHIQKAMDSLMRGRTSFVIAHRLSTVRDADLILVMDEGDVVEQGTHESLLASGGRYAELYRSQFDPIDAKGNR
jgi:ATP-binding cassette subfamily B protein